MRKKHSALLGICVGLSIFGLIRPSFAQSELENEFQSIAKKLNGNLGVSAEIIETGENSSYNGNKHFPMQSVYKFPIAIAVLHAVDQGKLSLDQKIHITKNDYIPSAGNSPVRDQFPDGADISIKELLRYSVSESDGSASDILLNALGGTKKAHDYIQTSGIKNIQIATTEQEQVTNDKIQYKNWTTPKAITSLLKVFYTSDKLSENSRAVLLKDMTESSPGKQRIKGLLPKGTIVAHKTGTSGTEQNGKTAATNDVGIITLPNGEHLALSVFVSDSYSSQKQRELVIAKTAKAAFDFYKH